MLSLWKQRSSSPYVMGIVQVTAYLACIAILHITTHFIKRPMAIVAPQTPRALPGSTDGAHSPLTPDESALLQRKEHALQLKLLKRRLVWDVLVCGVLVPASLGGLAWVVYAIVESFR